MAEKEQEPSEQAKKRNVFFSYEDSKAFKEAYDEAIEADKRSFRFKRETFDVVYAKYLMNHMQIGI